MSGLREAGSTSRPVEFLDLVYHTALLRWFSEFEIDSGSEKFQHYILRAEKRYVAWLQYLKERKPDPAMVLIPPIDVILMWHTHMLSPRRYIEDMYRLTNDDSLLVYNLPLKRINTVYIRKRVPETVDIKSWTLFTNLPYDLDMNDESPYEIACPWCGHHFEIQWLNYVDIRTSTKPQYSATCPDCQCQYSPEVVSAKQFWNDLAVWRNDHTEITAVRGIILDPNTGDWDLSRAEAILEKLDNTFQELEVQPPETWSSCNWSHILRYFTAAQSLLEIRHRHEEKMTLDTKQIESSYRNMVGPFSVKLWRMAAYNFQLFKRILPNFWATPEVTKRHCNKYHAYLLAMNEQDESTANSLEPDMAWLTHMLKPGHYREYMLLFAQKVVDFHDRVIANEQLLITASHDDFSSQTSHDSAVEFRTRTSTANSDNSVRKKGALIKLVKLFSNSKK
ncbi:hypothetical protein IWQ61_009933 [Dispira simplex]|nr:hypothetical protein IWQ61_009933 [Dispira simplex]